MHLLLNCVMHMLIGKKESLETFDVCDLHTYMPLLDDVWSHHAVVHVTARVVMNVPLAAPRTGYTRHTAEKKAQFYYRAMSNKKKGDTSLTH